mgnify:CR=1 FL=1
MSTAQKLTYLISEAVWHLSCPLNQNRGRIIPFRPHMSKWAQTCEKHRPRWDSNLRPGALPTEPLWLLTSVILWSVCRLCAKCDYAACRLILQPHSSRLLQTNRPALLISHQFMEGMGATMYVRRGRELQNFFGLL